MGLLKLTDSHRAPTAPSRLTSRDFVPWRFSDARFSARLDTAMPASENLHKCRSRRDTPQHGTQ